MKKVITIAVSVLLMLACFLTACDSSQGNEKQTSATTATAGAATEATTVATTEQATVETTVTTEATTEATTAASTEPPEPPKPITRLIEQILSSGEPVGRLIDKPVTVTLPDGITVDLNYLGWPSICVDENDVLYVAASIRLEHIDPLGATAFFKSEDGGVTWTEPRIINDGPLDDRDAGLVYMGNGRMLVSWFTHYAEDYLKGGQYSAWYNFSYLTQDQKNSIEAQLKSATGYEAERGSYVMISEDYGETWGEPIRVPVSTPHGPALMNNGDLIYIGREWNSKACGLSLELVGTTSHFNPIYAFVSSDGGQTWQERTKIEVPNISGGKFCEPHVLQLKNGRLICSIRVQGSVTPEIPTGFTVYTCYSDDNGYTWTMPVLVDSQMRGSPPHILEMKNGVLMMVYACRAGEYEFGEKARLSYDGGETWSLSEIMLDPAKDSDLGYPMSVQLSDGTLVTIYYQKYDNNGQPDSKCSILCTRWLLLTEEEMREWEENN